VHDLTSSEGQISVLRVRGPKWYRVISLTAANAVAEAQGMPGMHRHTLSDRHVLITYMYYISVFVLKKRKEITWITDDAISITEAGS